VTVEELRRELGNPPRPARFWQKPFDDHDPDRYEKLCQWAETDAPLPPRDRPLLLDCYLEELCYIEEIQPDLLLFLLPLLLRAWSMNLLGETWFYRSYAEQFWLAWNNRQFGPIRRASLLELLSEKQQRAFERYASDAFLGAIDRGQRLRSEGSGAYCYDWFYEMGSFATVCPGLEPLWREWWTLKSEGRAIGALQYLSCLMYEDDANPVFAPHTPDKGGGPPRLWADSMGGVNDQAWKPANVAFLKDALTPDRLFAAIDPSLERLSNAEDRQIAERMKTDFEVQRTLLEFRIEQLPEILASEYHGSTKWTV
jgi:hypothetical protein